MTIYDINKDLAQAVQGVLEGKKEVKEMEAKYPHDMFDPKTGKKEVAKDEAEHKALAAKGYTHEATDKSDDQNTDKVRKMHGVKKVDLDEVHDEALEMHEAQKVEAKDEDEDEDESTDEASDKQAKYKAFFDKALKKFGADSPADLEGDKKKEFFDYVDANYEAENEAD